MYIQPVEDSKIWEKFVRQFSPNNFLQSWAYGQFCAGLGDTPHYLGVYVQQQLIAVGLFIHTRARRGDHFACAAGPLVLGKQGQPILDAFRTPEEGMHYQHVLEAFTDYLRQEQGVAFARVRPNLLDSKDNQAAFVRDGFRPAPMHLHAERTWLLDISPEEDKLLAGMRKNTRYYVRRAAKEGVSVRLSTDPADIAILHGLQAETVSRQKFVAFSRSYFDKLFNAFLPEQQVALFIAEYEGKPIAVAMINFYGDMAVYHYAASDSAHAKLPGAYLILWEAIREAKRRGCQWFNFWGVVGEEQTDHPWYGLSQFKRGFGGEEKTCLHAQDLPFSWRYQLNYLIERLRKWKRGL